MTIYDIAEMANVSASMVSRVINNRPGVKADKKARIQELLKEYYFQPNEIARGLSTNVSRLVGILIADVRNAHYTELAYVIETYLHKRNYCALIVNTGIGEKNIESSIQMLSGRNVDGVIIIGSIYQNDHVKNLLQRFFSDKPIVFANGYLDLPNVYSVLVDEYQGVYNCVEYLYQHGYQNVVFMGRLNTPSNCLKAGGYKSAVCEKGKQVVVIEIDAPTLEETNFQPLDELMKIAPQVDAIIFSNDYFAGEAAGYFREHSIRIPEQIGLIGINNDRYCNIICPKLTTLDNKMEETGLTVAATLLDVLKGDQKPKKVMILSEIIERDSVRRRIK